jgi:hypothetical protein
LSLINTYKEPQDLVFKLLREGRRTWLASDPQDKCDHFFNYCVTAHALRDWCIKHLGADKDVFHKEMNSIKYFPECRDIANSSKHFGLNTKPACVSGVSPTESEFAILTGDGNADECEFVKGPDIFIALTDGTQIDLFEFLNHTANSWIEVLKSKAIPINSGYKTIYMFIELNR